MNSILDKGFSNKTLFLAHFTNLQFLVSSINYNLINMEIPNFFWFDEANNLVLLMLNEYIILNIKPTKENNRYISLIELFIHYNLILLHFH